MMHKIMFSKYYKAWDHPGYLYLKNEARKEGWSGTRGLQGMLEERYGKNARLYIRYSDIIGIGFKHVEDYNEFILASGVNKQLEMF